MGAYIVRRLIQSVLILIGLSVVFFVLLHLTPGGPCAAFQSAGLGAQAEEHACAMRLGLNQPLIVQYADQMGRYLHGDLGTTKDGTPVATTILSKVPATVLLMGTAYLLQELVALPLGIFAALKRYSFFDQLFTLASYAGLSMPTFWLGLILIFFFAVQLNILPEGRVQDVTLPVFWSAQWFAMLARQPAVILIDLARHLVMPVVVLMITGVAADSRFMRASMLEVVNQDYIRTARAKGLPRTVVIFKHASRNAILPIITNIALYLPALIGGAVITETIFSWGGLGYLFFQSITGSDYPTIQALLMMGAVATLLANLLADLTYAWVDPRIRYD